MSFDMSALRRTFVRGGLLGGFALLSAGAGCGDATGPGAEQRVAVDEIVTGSLDGVGRVAVFAFDGDEGRTLRAFFQATSGNGSDSLLLQVLSPDGTSVLTRVSSAGSQPTLEQRAGSVFALPVTGRYRVEVRGVDTGTDRGPFRFRIVPIDLGPEASAATLVVGNVVSESIGTPGDVDEFTFQGSGGDEMVAFIQGTNGPATDSLVLTIGSRELVPLQRTAFSPGSADSVRAHGTGRFVLPATGSYVARVAGRRVSTTMDYRLELARVSRAPEQAAQVIPIGTIVEEAIDFFGDLDEFHLDAAQGDRFTLRFERVTGTASVPVRIELLDPSGFVVLSRFEFTGDQSAWTRVSTTAPLRAGRHRLRLTSHFTLGGDPDAGRYRFLFERATP